MNAYTLSIPSKLGPEEISVLPRSTGDHPILAWHGITAVNRSWFWDAIWHLGEVNLVGLPGHGPLQEQPDSHFSDWTPEHFIEVATNTVLALNKGKPATLIGHSTGGMIALAVALARPDLVQRLILISPVVWRDLTGIVGVWQKFAHSPRLLNWVVGASLGPGRMNINVFKSSLVSFINDRKGFYGNDHVLVGIKEGYEDICKTQINAIAGTVRVLTQADMRPKVLQSNNKVPTLLIHGHNDPIIPFSQAEWLSNNLANCTLAGLPGAGHLPYAEQEHVVNKLVSNWLESNAIAPVTPVQHIQSIEA